MIVGHGDIAKVLQDREGAILFASGVSDSSCYDESEYFREKKMIESFQLNRATHTFFYFSSISIMFKTSRYTKHKQEMEELVRRTYIHSHIIRLGNIFWGENPNTFLNYLKNRVDKGQEVNIKDECKFMIDKVQLRMIVNSLPLMAGHNTISIFEDAMKVETALKYYTEWKA